MDRCRDKMDSTVFPTLTLLVLLLSGTCFAEDTETLPCPEYQEGFDGSCYEFVSLQRSFLSAEGWCERGGGHLAFILNDETQQFLQKHLEPEKDWWLGLAPAAPNLTLDSVATKGEKWFGQGRPYRSCMTSKDSLYIIYLMYIDISELWYRPAGIKGGSQVINIIQKHQ